MMLWGGAHYKEPTRSGVIGTIVVGFIKYVSCCGLNFVDKRHISKSTKNYAP